jgi:hypothetical protein
MTGLGQSLGALCVSAVKLKRCGVEPGRMPNSLHLTHYSCLSSFAASVPQM